MSRFEILAARVKDAIRPLRAGSRPLDLELRQAIEAVAKTICGKNVVVFMERDPDTLVLKTWNLEFQYSPETHMDPDKNWQMIEEWDWVNDAGLGPVIDDLVGWLERGGFLPGKLAEAGYTCASALHMLRTLRKTL
jgi:hypothetical protein